MATVNVKRAGGIKAHLDALAKKMQGKPMLRVGFLENAKYPDGTSVAMVAAIQNFGAPNARFPIPARPFFSQMIHAHSKQWGPNLIGILKKNNLDFEDGLKKLGEIMTQQLRQSIVDTNTPVLSTTTLMLRKMKKQDPTLRMGYSTVIEAQARVAAGRSYAGVSTKPLVAPGVAGGLMLKSVSYEVKMK